MSFLVKRLHVMIAGLGRTLVTQVLGGLGWFACILGHGVQGGHGYIDIHSNDIQS